MGKIDILISYINFSLSLCLTHRRFRLTGLSLWRFTVRRSAGRTTKPPWHTWTVSSSESSSESIRICHSSGSWSNTCLSIWCHY